MLIGIAVLVVGSLLGFLAVRKPDWIRWSVTPSILLALWIGFRFMYY